MFQVYLNFALHLQVFQKSLLVHFLGLPYQFFTSGITFLNFYIFSFLRAFVVFYCPLY